jgi:hypothetical protein
MAFGERPSFAACINIENMHNVQQLADFNLVLLLLLLGEREV